MKLSWDSLKSAIVTAVVLALIWSWLSYSVQVEAGRTTDLRDELVSSCERVNDLREETNDIIASLQEFLEAAASARSVRGDVDVAERYRDIAAEIEPVEVPDCQEAVRPV